MKLLLLLLAGNLGAAIPVTSGLVLHLDSTVGVTYDGANLVSAWADQSGSGDDAIQGTEANRPVFVEDQYDGRPWINFVSTDSLTCATGEITGTDARTVMVLQQSFDTASSDIAFGLGRTLADSRLWSITDTTVYGRGGAFDVTGLDSFGNRGSNVVQVVTVTWDGVDGDASLNRYADTVQVTTNGGTAAWDTSAGYIVGNWSNLDRPFGGGIVEIAVYERVLTDTERNAVVAYMLERPADGTDKRGLKLKNYLRMKLGKKFLPLLFTAPLQAAPQNQVEDSRKNIKTWHMQGLKGKKDKIKKQIATGEITRTRTPTPMPFVSPTMTRTPNPGQQQALLKVK